MQRRSLLKLAAVTAGAATWRAASGASGGASGGTLAAGLLTPTQPAVKRVLVVFKCHLDVGFSLTQAQVMRRYFDVYYPAAMERAAKMRATGGDRYVWTTGSWLLYEYLEQATPAQRREMERAIAHGDIAWHALPFSWQTELLDRSMIEGGLGFSAALDRRFGHTTTGAKMTDVPGHSRGLVAPLAAAGVKLLDIGVNHASTPPDVPDVFLWQDHVAAESTAAPSSVVMLYHRLGYGSTLQIPGSDLAIDVEVRGDNSGPHTPEEIAAIYAGLRKQFPGATIHAASLTQVANAVDRYRETLPVVTQEIGDTWIYGVPSDPLKVARYRELSRMRRQWIATDRFAAADATDLKLLRRALLSVEHTWGTDTKSYLDDDHYRPADLVKVLDRHGYQVMQTSWQEKRDDLFLGIGTLPEPLQHEANARLSALIPSAPATTNRTPHDPAQTIRTRHFYLALDPETGAIRWLQNRANGHSWASADHPLALVTYQTLSAEDYTDYRSRYIRLTADWARRDFGKPGIEKFGARSQMWHPRLVACWADTTPTGHRILIHSQIDDPAAMTGGNVAWPTDMYLELVLPNSEPAVHMRLVTLGKPINRMPEAMWLSFDPVRPKETALRAGEAAAGAASRSGWTLEKVGQPVALSDVVRGGGRAMHAVGERIHLNTPAGRPALSLDTLDAPVIAFGDLSPLDFSRQLPASDAAAHVCLFTNAWGTNYIQWAGGEWAYRFTLRA